MTIGNGEFECRKILPQNVDTIYQKNANANMDTIVLPKKSAKNHTFLNVLFWDTLHKKACYPQSACFMLIQSSDIAS